jgi:FtsP/CotA-like multicopper oxidase with cupredoxin domain
MFVWPIDMRKKRVERRYRCRWLEAIFRLVMRQWQARATTAAFVLTIGAAGFGALRHPVHPQATDLCTRPASERTPPSADLYCVRLVPIPSLRGVTAYIELARTPSAFGTQVTSDGRQRYDAQLTVRGLPDPTTLGQWTTYVAWLTTPTLFPEEKLREVGNGTFALGTIDWNKFLIIISAERSAATEERTGRIVLRGVSPSSRMQPPDLMEFLWGAGKDSGGDLHMMMHDGADGGWPRPPMPVGVAMFPALMQLGPPPVTPYLPQQVPDDVALARPRQVVRMDDGDTLDLEAQFVRRKIRGREFVMYGFNGQYPGPLIWVPQGATITVNFTNNIDWPSSVHWHGVRLENAFDGVPGLTQDPVPPGGRFVYRVHFRDAGIYWYHPHHREDVQQDLGLYGNMLVRSPDPNYYSPANSEAVVMLDDLLANDGGLIPFGKESATHTLMGRFGNVFLINGEPDYRRSVSRGEVVRFYFTNVSNTRTFNISFGGLPIKVVGSDVGNFEQEEWVESVVIAPAERYIVHVRFPEAGTVPLVNNIQAIDHLNGRFLPQSDTLGFITVEPKAVAQDYVMTFDALRKDARVAADIDPYRSQFSRPVDHTLELTMERGDVPLVVQRVMQFDSAYFNPVEWSGTMPMMNWASTAAEARWILRDPDTGRENMEIDNWSFRVGDVVKIRLANRREAFHAMQHPIHIHGQRFLVLAVNGVPNTNLVWKDTVLIPAGAAVDILLELSNPGRWMLHCHIAEHLETGMMLAFTVRE